MLTQLGLAVFVLWMSPWSMVLAGGQENVIDEVKSILTHYATESHAQNPALYDLYSDRAAITTRVEGMAKPQIFVGREFKKQMRGNVARRDIAMDASIFTDVVMERRAGRLIIQAKRYATNRCYWDHRFRLGLEREGGHYRIVEESSYANPQAHCDLATAQESPSRPAPAPLAVTALPHTPPAVPPDLVDSRSAQHMSALASGSPALLNVIPAPPGGMGTPPLLSLPSPNVIPPPLPSKLTPEQQMLAYMELAKRIAAQSSQPQDPSLWTPMPPTPAGTVSGAPNGRQGNAPLPDDGLHITPP